MSQMIYRWQVDPKVPLGGRMYNSPVYLYSQGTTKLVLNDRI